MKKSEINKDSPSLTPHGSDSDRQERRPLPDDPMPDQPAQPDPSRASQEQMTDYPGIKGPKVRDLEQDDAMDQQEAEQVKDSAGKKADVDHAETKPLGKESRNDQ